MTAQELLSAILSATEPSRDLDRLIAVLAGYKSRGGAKQEEFWASPVGVEMMKLPQFTGSIHDGLELAKYLFPDVKIGCAWDEDGGYAKIGDGPYHKANTTSLALSAAIVAMITSKA